MKPPWIWFEIGPLGFGAKIDYTTWTNMAFQAAFFILSAWILRKSFHVKDLRIAGFIVAMMWFRGELEQAWQYQWNQGNFFDFIEFGTGLMWLIVPVAIIQLRKYYSVRRNIGVHRR